MLQFLWIGDKIKTKLKLRYIPRRYLRNISALVTLLHNINVIYVVRTE